MNEANEIWNRLRETDENIKCIVSTSKISGRGVIVDSHQYNDIITFDVIIEDVKHEIVCFGILIL